MNHSLYSADRTTHLKIVVVALAAAIAVAGLATSSHVNSSTETAGIIKAGNPVVMTSSTLTLTR